MNEKEIIVSQPDKLLHVCSGIPILLGGAKYVQMKGVSQNIRVAVSNLTQNT